MVAIKVLCSGLWIIAASELPHLNLVSSQYCRFILKKPFELSFDRMTSFTQLKNVDRLV